METPMQQAAGNVMAVTTVWFLWMLLAPIIAGPVPPVKPEHNCPSPYVVHGVGSDNRTFTRIDDRCADRRNPDAR